MSNITFALLVTVSIAIIIIFIKSIIRFKIYFSVKKIVFSEIYNFASKKNIASEIEEREIVVSVKEKFISNKLEKYVDELLIYFDLDYSLNIEFFLNYLGKKHKFIFVLTKEEIDSMLS
ncbi:hypothetical protein [Helicovermis profundi]|uniref:ATP synthase F0 subunit 8 n=1 Tax=Helicovermis profundi TaxID=3065157 RepID=A0AAU9EJT6_9FIRM|nr:hypothetical protein HLPR_21840 [Clostridia bacterium S502]